MSEQDVVEPLDPTPPLDMSRCWNFPGEFLKTCGGSKNEGDCGDFDSWSFFLLRKRPPGPLALFNAWRWRDSWRYGCIITYTRIGLRHKSLNQSKKLYVSEYWCDTDKHTLRTLMSLFWASSFARCCLRRRMAWYCFAFTKIGSFSGMMWGKGILEWTNPPIWGCCTCKYFHNKYFHKIKKRWSAETSLRQDATKALSWDVYYRVLWCIRKRQETTEMWRLSAV